MDTTTKVRQIGGSLMLILPQLYARHLNIREGDELVLRDEEGKRGKFISFWKVENETEHDRIPRR